MSQQNRILVKLRRAPSLAALDPRANLRLLHESDAEPQEGFALSRTSAWYVAELPADAPTPWDTAHAQVAAQLGIDSSDVIFAEPDLEQNVYPDTNEEPAVGEPFAAADRCEPTAQDSSGGRAVGPKGVFAWHLGDAFSQLGSAREAVAFSEPRTLIAHVDTGYDRNHVTRPEHVRQDLERNFVDGDGNPHSSQDPNSGGLLDNSGHGTGTIGILAGGKVAAFDGAYLGGAPQAEVVPLRVSDRVVLFRTSAFAQALRYAVECGCDVLSASMGGLPSRAWNEAVNDAYERGVCLVTAAGNNVNGAPTRHVVYPARYRRVIAACGVMRNGKPYANLTGLKTLEGNFGPDSSMRAAVAAYTPNIPWARFGCGDVVRLNGEGTSAATPQVAAAVALWFEKYKGQLPRDWRRVEAVRHALFSTAQATDAKHFGRGILKARAALEVRPVLNLPKTPADSDSFAFLRVITGFGVAEPPPRELMFNLELAQRWLLNPALQENAPDPDEAAGLSPAKFRRFMEAVIEDKGASLALRKHVAARYPFVVGRAAPTPPPEVAPPATRICEKEPTLVEPPYRRVRVYAVDPSFSTRLSTASVNEVALKVRWENLEPGPKGEYLEVVDRDAADGASYTPADLDDPALLAQDGWPPFEGNPAFHQQMVYAVAMKTIENFEQALGRPVLWRPSPNPKNDFDDSGFTRRLVVRPHALRQANAFYSPKDIELKFGYFEASSADPGRHAPGSRVYTCLSHDIIAHETTHAILDGMHRRYGTATNPDVLAFHEGFADIVALMQHFTIPELLQNEIGRTRGDLETESTLGQLAVQFGQAQGGRAALREAIGSLDETGAWKRLKPDPAKLQRRVAPHARGAILVAAVFDAFLAIYKSRTADLLRIYTGGTGVLPDGAIHPDLVNRLADEATQSALHVLKMCIRALDYIPPVDITFGEYLRGLITADFELVGGDRHNYRVAFVEAFRAHGLYPRDLDTISVDTLRWQDYDYSHLLQRDRASVIKQYRKILERLRSYADDCVYIRDTRDREQLFRRTRQERVALHHSLSQAFAATPKFAADLGLASGGEKSGVLPFEVHELSSALINRPDGRHVQQLVVSLAQWRTIDVDGRSYTFTGGPTLVIDLAQLQIKYRITKNINSKTREERTVEFLRGMRRDPLLALMFGAVHAEPFALVHALAEEGTF